MRSTPTVSEGGRAWRRLGGTVSRHRELALAVTFVGVAGWEFTDPGPRGPECPRGRSR